MSRTTLLISLGWMGLMVGAAYYHFATGDYGHGAIAAGCAGMVLVSLICTIFMAGCDDDET